MNKKILLTFIFVGIIAVLGTVSAKAQANLMSKYSYQMSIDDGRNTLDLIFELRAKNVVVYRNEQNGEETQKRFGTWNWSKKTNRITIIMPPVKKNPVQGQEKKLTFVFSLAGKNLKLIKDLPYKTGKGEIYQRQN